MTWLQCETGTVYQSARERHEMVPFEKTKIIYIIGKEYFC